MSSFEPLGKFLTLTGVFIVVLGLLLMLWGKIPLLGRLPGDMSFQKGNLQFFFPIVTCLVMSAVLTLVVNLVIRLLGK